MDNMVDDMSGIERYKMTSIHHIPFAYFVVYVKGVPTLVALKDFNYWIY